MGRGVSIWLIVLAVLALLIAGVVLMLRDQHGVYFTSGASFGLCQANDDIEAAERERIETAALSWFELFQREPLEARHQMSRRGRAATRERGLVEQAGAQANALNSSAPIVQETYYLRYSSGAENGALVPCVFHDGRPAFAARGATLASAVVIAEIELPSASARAVSFWLEREYGEWRIRAATWGPSRLNGHDAERLIAQGREQRQRGNLFNATILYAAANMAMNRGEYYQHHLAKDIRAEAQTLSAPTLLQGEPPHRWRFGDNVFSVMRVEYMVFESGERGLIVPHAAEWGSHPEADALNRELIDNFNVAYPEWREVFDLIAARAYRADGVIWGTLYSREDGYTRAPLTTDE